MKTAVNINLKNLMGQQPQQPSAAALARGRANNDLVSLAAPTIELILQIRAGLIKPSNDMRRNVDHMLKEMEQRAATLRFNDQQIQAVKFALAAFVDEIVLTTDFHLREEWEKYPLQLEYFGEHLAGIKFFDRLDEMLKNPEAHADVLEVYYLCMVAGYKGKYKIYMEEQLKAVILNTAQQLVRANRLKTPELSPHWKVTDQPQPPSAPKFPVGLAIAGGATILITFVLYLALFLILNSNVQKAVQELLR
jgi:type VI secretion system protein ImpK